MDTKVKHKFRFTAQQCWHYRNSAHFSFHGCSFIDASGASSFHHLNRGSCSEQYENNKTEINSMLCVTEVCASWWKMVELTQTKATTADTVQQQVLFQHQSLLVSLQTLLHITVTALFSDMCMLFIQNALQSNYKLSCTEILPAESGRFYLANWDPHLFNLISFFKQDQKLPVFSEHILPHLLTRAHMRICPGFLTNPFYPLPPACNGE